MTDSGRSAVDRPVFLLGSGRSGTTPLYHLMAVHPEVCWFSNLSNRLPWLPWAPLAHRLADTALFGPGMKQHILRRRGGKKRLAPVEAEIIYDRAGLLHDRRTTEADFDPRVAENLRQAVANHVRYSGKRRFLSKQTANNQRYRLLNRIFPDALFVHLIRDGRAVANSIRGQGWLDVMSLWWLEDKASNHIADYTDPIELCGMHWQRNLDELLAGRELLGERYLEIRYEDMIHDVHGTVGQVLEFADLTASPEYFALLPEQLPDMNDKWRADLSDEQIGLLHGVIGPRLEALGYPV